MKIFISAIVLILFFTFFAVSNTMMVPIKFPPLVLSVPLSLALILPTGIVLLLFAFFHVRMTSKMTIVIRNLEDTVEQTQKEIVAITKKRHELEIENRKMKIRLGDVSDEDDASL